MQSYWKKLIVAVLAVATSAAFATCPNGYSDTQEPSKPFTEQGHAKTEGQMMAGYNAPARTDTHGYDFFVWGSFIYWQGMQEHMDLGFYMEGANTGYVRDRQYFDMEFDWHPGFKVGIGTSSDYDHWDFMAEYTWLHATNKKSYTIDPAFWLYVPRFDRGYANTNHLSGSWEMDFDILDGEMARRYYVGTKLTLRTHFGVRAAWLNQKYKEKMFVYPNATVGSPAAWWYYSGRTRNWSVGPRLGLDVNWLFAEGFRLMGSAATSILYSRYNVTEREDNVWNTDDLEFNNIGQRHKFYALRPNLEIQSGLGWGTYFGDGEYYFDLSALYEFHVFWRQEAMRYDTVKGDLTLNGLTVTARFDF